MCRIDRLIDVPAEVIGAKLADVEELLRIIVLISGINLIDRDIIDEIVEPAL
jgi:hypothetical protein